MLLNTWLNDLKARLGRAAGRPNRRRNAYRPVLESLEDRTLMAISLLGVPNWVEQGPGPLFNGAVQGIPNGPVAGAIQTIAPHPTQANTVLIGSVNGGIWRTTNANAASPTWTPLIDDFPSLSITSIAFSPRDGTNNTIYASVGASSAALGRSGPFTGLLKSTDGSATWQLVGPQLRGLDISKVVPADGMGLEVVLVATRRFGDAASNGLFRSTNGGLTFTRVLTGNFTDVVQDTGNTSRFYAARIDGDIGPDGPDDGAIFRSEDGGVIWARIDPAAVGASTAINIKLAVSQSVAPDPVYAGIVRLVTDAPGTTRLTGLFRSGNAGATWVQAPLPGTIEPPLIGTFVGIHPAGQGVKHFSLAADPNDPDVVYVGGDANPVPILDPGGRLFRGDFTPAVIVPEICIPFTTICIPAVLAPFWEPVFGIGAALSAPHADSRELVFDLSGNLLEGDDGGIYKLIHPEGSLNPLDLRRWVSLNGNLRITELVNLAYDSRNNAILAGAQDNGVVEMTGGIGSPDPNWRVASLIDFFGLPIVSLTGDGQIQAVDATSDAPNVIRYSLGNNLARFFRRTFNASGSQISVTTPVLLAAPATPVIPLSGLLPADADQGTGLSRTLYVLNAVTPSRMLLSGRGVYESTNRGDTIVPVGALPVAGTPTVRALAYGGTNPNGTPNADVAYVARGAAVTLRATAGGAFVAVLIPGAVQPGRALPADVEVILDIVLDPSNFRTAFLVAGAGRVFRLNNVGLASQSVTELTGNLPTIGAQGLGTIEVFRSATGQRVVLVGGRDGVYRTLDSDTLGARSSWHEFGAGLPNAPVTDIRHDPTDNRLLVSTHGRGAWTLDGASTALVRQSTLGIGGDDREPNQNDAITLVRNAAKPWLLDVFLNAPTTGPPSLSVRLSTLQNIVVNGLGGNDTLTVDSVNGPIAVPGGIQFDGGAGAFTDTLALQGGSATLDRYDALPGNAARSTILFETDDDFDGTNQSVTQTVNTLGMEAVRDLVDVGRGGGLTLNYRLLELADTLTLQDDLVSTLRVTSTGTASVQFGNKRSLELNAGDRADRINLVNTVLPFPLDSLTVNARGGIDTINVQTAVVATVIDAGGGADIINVGLPFDTTLGSFVTLKGINALLTVRGGPGDTLNVTRTEVLLESTPGQMDRTAPGSAQLRITGLGMNGQIRYEAVTNVNVALGSGADVFTVVATAAGVNTTVGTSGGPDTIFLGGGTVTTVNDIRGPLTINAGGSADDRVILREFEPAGFVNVGTLGTPLNAGPGTGFFTGFGMGARVDFTNAESVLVIEGASNDSVTFQFSSAPMFGVSLILDGGNDGVVFQGSNRNDRIRVSRRVGPDGPEVVAQINGRTIVAGYRDGETVSVRAGRGNDRVTIDDSVTTWRAELFGEDGKDHLVGSLRDDLLVGGNGNDLLEGGGGNDLLSGSDGNDRLQGGDGDDVLIGGPGRDVFRGGAGADRVFAADGGLDLIFADVVDLLLELDRRDRVVRV